MFLFITQSKAETKPKVNEKNVKRERERENFSIRKAHHRVGLTSSNALMNSVSALNWQKADLTSVAWQTISHVNLRSRKIVFFPLTVPAQLGPKS